jgi:hypothetical protein
MLEVCRNRFYFEDAATQEDLENGGLNIRIRGQATRTLQMSHNRSESYRRVV